ncbi:MAG: hypothetical protein ACRDQZ_13080 [Mycobacteriales bacterium]
MSTPRDLVVAAYGLSAQNKPDQIATAASELLDVYTRAMRGLWAFTARVNPEFFGESAAVGYVAPGWARPTKAELVWRIENPTGKEVVVVPRGDLAADLARPSVWTMGQIYRSAGNALDPVNGNLTFFYSLVYQKPVSLDDPITALWPAQFDDLLVREIGLYLALKDGRSDELGPVGEERDRWAQLYSTFLEHETATRVFRYGSIRVFNVPALIAAHLAPSVAQPAAA